MLPLLNKSCRNILSLEIVSPILATFQTAHLVEFYIVLPGFTSDKVQLMFLAVTKLNCVCVCACACVRAYVGVVVFHERNFKDSLE